MPAPGRDAPVSQTPSAAPVLAVFGPSLLLTVTIESGPDGPAELHLHAGGQGLWVARMAATLGAAVTLCSALGGESGRVLGALLADERVEFVWARSAAANGAYVHEHRSGRRRSLAEVPGGQLTRHELDDLYGLALTAALRSGTLVLTGSNDRVTDADTYRRLAADAAANGARVVADLTGEPLRGALSGGLDVLKLSEEALPGEGLSGATPGEAVRELHRRGARSVILSRAREGALALVEGRVLEVRGPRLVAADHRGAGDSMTAAASVGIAAGLPAERWLRLAVAAGALNATRHGLGTGTREEVEALVDHVRLTEVPASAGG
jgi:1-phosphofructokinase